MQFQKRFVCGERIGFCGVEGRSEVNLSQIPCCQFDQFVKIGRNTECNCSGTEEVSDSLMSSVWTVSKRSPVNQVIDEFCF